MTGLSAETQRVLRAGGWSPGRRISTAAWRDSFAATGLVMPGAAAAFLGEFGGLIFDLTGAAGPEGGRAWHSFEIDPMLAWSYAEQRFAAGGRRVGRNIFPIGEVNRGQAFLGMDEEAEVYLVKDRIASFGALPGALDNLVADVMPRPIR
jgi:hypothetical protein